MYGQKQIFQCLTVIVLITVLNFYRSAIRRDKETQKNLKMKREQQEKPQVDVSNVVETMAHQFDGDESESKWTQLEPQCDSDDCNAVGMSQFAVRPDSTLRNEKIDVCDNNEKTCSMADGRHHSTTKEVLDAEVHQNEINHNENDRDVNLKKTDSDKGITEKFQKQQQREKRSTTTGKTKANKRIITKTKINGSFIETAGVLTYIAVTILLASLIKAAVDVSKHTREKRQRKSMDDNELLRRCSLQKYSMVKQQQLQQQQNHQHQQKENNNGKRKSVPKIIELVPQSSVDSSCNNPKIKEQSRRMSTNPQDYLNGSGIITEPGSPVKPGKLLAKLAPRRPSMESLSEDDNSSPDVKRRVRMINRH